MRARLTLLVYAGLLGGVASAQPEPWRHVDGSYHYYDAVSVPGGVDWSRAYDSARALGGYLATLTSPEENAFVFGLTDADGLWSQGQHGLVGPWIGARQPAGSQEPDGGWRWITGELCTYANWSDEEPDNEGGADVAGFGEVPGTMASSWNDRSVSDTVVTGFVAEFSAGQTTVGLLALDSAAAAGYTLFAPVVSNLTYLIDNRGRSVRSWQSAYPPGLSADLLANGHLLRPARINNSRFPSAGGRIEEYSWDGDLVWSYDYSTQLHCQHHDVGPMPDGHVLMVAWEAKTRAEAVAAGRRPDRAVDGVWPDHVVEVDPATDSVVWEWHVWDHLIQDYDSTKANFGTVANHPELVDLNFEAADNPDWLHVNAVDYNPALDQVLLSVHNFSEVWVIDHSTTTAEAAGHSGGRQGMGGDILYRWGNPQVYRAGTADDQVFFGQHDARWVEPGFPGAGHITVFNNGLYRPAGAYSTVDEFIPPIDSAGRYARPAPGVRFDPLEPCWTYIAAPPESLYSGFISSAQRLANGNTLVCVGNGGCFREVAPDGRLVWRYQNPVASATLVQGDDPALRLCDVFRTVKYAPDYSGFQGRKLVPGYPVEGYATPPLGIAGPTGGGGQAATILDNTPDPFERATTIRFRLPVAQVVELIILDQVGRVVRTLVGSSCEAGVHSVVWDGRDQSGKKLPSGVYFCRLQAGGRSSGTRLTLLRQ
jgi:hypothetical protein